MNLDYNLTKTTRVFIGQKGLKFKLIVQINQYLTSKFKIKRMRVLSDLQSKKKANKKFSSRRENILGFLPGSLRLQQIITLHRPMKRKTSDPSTKK